jgi:hypothetical protein
VLTHLSWACGACAIKDIVFSNHWQACFTRQRHEVILKPSCCLCKACLWEEKRTLLLTGFKSARNGGWQIASGIPVRAPDGLLRPLPESILKSINNIL